MYMEILPVFSVVWNDDDGYVETDQCIGFKAVSARGDVLAYGETAIEARDNAAEAQWGAYRQSEEGMPPSASAVVAR